MRHEETARDREDDAELVRRIKAEIEAHKGCPYGRGEAWEELEGRCVPVLKQLARSCVRRGVDPDDLQQEVRTALFLKLPRLVYDPDRGPLRAWLAVIARHALADLAERRRSQSAEPLRPEHVGL
jgi:DNA-directed RNA polymerase specialized sigma24 family protein